jgi:hypothetical protein
MEPEQRSFTAANSRHLNDLLKELTSRRREALRIYTPYPNQDAFHRSVARKRLAVGGNRGGKTLVCAAEVARALGKCDPHDKYKSRRPQQWIFVGKDLIHCSKVMFRLLFKPGAFQIIRDLGSGDWRSYDPRTDAGREEACRDAAPFIPKRLVKSISWEDKKEEVARTVQLADGSECTFFSSVGEPPQGWRVDGVWMDEEIEHPKWFSEMVPRLVDKGGVLIWSFTPQIGTPAAYDLITQADETASDPAATVQRFFFNIFTNVYMPEDKRRAFVEDMSRDEEEYKVRVEGRSALEGQRVYPEFSPRGVHRCDSFPVPDDWTRYVFIDPGRQVAAALFLAVPPPGSSYSAHEAVVYDEIYQRKANAEVFSKAMKAHLGDQWVHEWVIDGHMARAHDMGPGKDVETWYRDAFLADGLAHNNFKGFIWGSDDLDAGILAVKSKLHIVGGMPKWVFQVERLRWLIWESDRYANKKISRVNVITDKPEKRHDHLMDCWRYAAMHNLRYVTPPRRKKPAKSWSEKYLKAKKTKALKQTPSSGGVAVF